LTITSIPSTSPVHPLTLMQSPAGMVVDVVHATVPPAGVHVGSCPPPTGYREILIPAGATVLPRLQTGTVPPQATPTVRSTPGQLGLVWPGSQEMQLPRTGQVWLHTEATLSTHELLQTEPGPEQQSGSAPQIAATQGSQAAESRTPV
jgi:hypothetical protein